MEKAKGERDRYKGGLEKIMHEFESKEKEMIKNLSDRLKLSEKFVKTSQF